MKLFTTILFCATLFAQTGRVFIPTPNETTEAKQAYAKVTAAEAALKVAQDEWSVVRKSIKKSHGIAGKDVDIDFNAEFTTFEKSPDYTGSGYITSCGGGCIVGSAYTCGNTICGGSLH